MADQHNILLDLCQSINCVPYTDKISLEAFRTPESLAARSTSERLAASLQVLFDLSQDLSDIPDTIDNSLIDVCIAAIDETISQQLDKVIHHKQFQELEALWRGLAFTIERSASHHSIKLDMFDAEKIDLLNNFNDVTDITQSVLYHRIYIDEYDTPGGEPYTAVISPFDFTTSSADIAFLRNLSKVSHAAHCPFIGSVGPEFFHKKTIDDVNEIADLTTYLQRAEYITWNSFRESEDARYIGLTFPKILLRPPYPEATVTKQFRYRETLYASDKSSLLWGSASFAFASNLINSFHQYGWCVNIRGPETGGKVTNLPVAAKPVYHRLFESFPVETLLSETRELSLANLGFIPLTYYKNTDYACFFSANSVHAPATFDDKQLTANCRINARLPYIFLSTRIAHYLKVLQRETIGSQKSAAELAHELNAWLKTLITKMNHPSPELLGRHPLQDGYVEVNTVAESPGVFQVNLYATPHFQIEGMDITLNLQTHLPTNHTKQ